MASPQLCACLDVDKEGKCKGEGKERGNGKNERKLLYKACENGCVGCVRTLIAAGADVNARYKDWSPLFAACYKGNLECLHILVAAGADVTRKVWSWKTLLDVACEFGHAECLCYVLFELPPHPRVNMIKGKFGMRALALACEHGHIECARILLERGVPTDGEEYEQTPLFHAAMSGHYEIMHLLIRYGADVNCGEEPALITCDAECVRILLEAGADPTIPSEDHGTPLDFALFHGHDECVRLLVKHGIDINERDCDETILMKACETCEDECVADMLKAGADVHAVDEHGVSALDYACIHGHPGVMRILVAAGASVHNHDRRGQSTLKRLIDLISTTTHDIELARDNERRVRALIGFNAHIEAACAHSMSPWM
jgi:ankyrin repeat protein